MKVILVCGVIGSGKDHFVKTYRQEHPDEDIQELKFAYPIRQMVGRIKGVDLMDEQTYEKWKSVPENRLFLVNFGQWAKDYMWEGIWVDAVCRKMTEDKTYIISDFRFPVEFETIKSKVYFHDMKVRFCNYKSERYAIRPEQPSERLACWLIEQGYEHGKLWSWFEFEKVINDYLKSTK